MERNQRDPLAKQTHREVVDTAVELVEDDKTSTWTTILRKSGPKIGRWVDEPQSEPSPARTAAHPQSS